MRKTGLVLVGVAVLILLAAFGIGLLRQPSDAQLVRQAIEEAAKAAREGRPGGVLDNLSAEASLNGQTAPSLGAIADTIRRFRPDVELQPADPKIIGDEARVATSGTVTVGLAAAKTSLPISKVTVVLAKEPDTFMLLIPTHKWRVTRVELPDEVAQTLLAQFATGAF